MIKIAAPLHHQPHPSLQWIEVATFLQIPGFQIVGLPNQEVAEARERIRAAIEASSFDFPRRRVVLNLSPASIKKRGTGLDLAMALAVLESSLGTSTSPPQQIMAWGELGLDGSIKPAGQLTRSIFAAWDNAIPLLLIAQEEEFSAQRTIQAIGASGLLSAKAPPRIIGCTNLARAWEIVQTYFSHTGSTSWPIDGTAVSFPPEVNLEPQLPSLLPLAPNLERAILAAAAGIHHVFLLGPRGSGKSYAMDWLCALYPPTLPSTLVHNRLISELEKNSLEIATDRLPVRRVSAQVRPSALIGGFHGGALRPGEFSMAHEGILIADEFPEWPRDSREALREPMELGKIQISRSEGAATFPARFVLAGNGNLCPCGGWPPQLPLPENGNATFPCRCTPAGRTSYLNRLSGPILDRIDIMVLSHPYHLIASTPDSACARKQHLIKLQEKVINARNFAQSRWDQPAGLLNAAALETLLERNTSWKKWERSRLQRGPVSLRSRHKIARVALTLAALEETAQPQKHHFLEAECYRAEKLGLFPSGLPA